MDRIAKGRECRIQGDGASKGAPLLYMPYFKVDWCGTNRTDFHRALNMDSCDGSWHIKAPDALTVRKFVEGLRHIDKIVGLEEVTPETDATLAYMLETKETIKEL